LLERISRLQARLNERVSLAGLAHSIALDKRNSETVAHRDMFSAEKDRLRKASRLSAPPSAARKPDPNHEGGSREPEGGSWESNVDAFNASHSTPGTLQAAPIESYSKVLQYLDKGANSPHGDEHARILSSQSLRTRVNELEDTLRASEAESRKLRHFVTKTQAAYAHQSAELTNVSMALDTSKQSQESLQAQLKTLQADQENSHNISRTETHKQSPKDSRKDSNDWQLTFARMSELEEQLEVRNRKIARLENLLVEAAGTARSPSRKTSGRHAASSKDAPAGHKGEKDREAFWDKEEVESRQRQHHQVRDPELEQYEQDAETAGNRCFRRGVYLCVCVCVCVCV